MTSPIEPHEWDNKNISEQRDWAVAQLASSREATSIPQQAFTQSAREIRRLEKALEAERQRRAQVEQALRGLLSEMRVTARKASEALNSRSEYAGEEGAGELP